LITVDVSASTEQKRGVLPTRPHLRHPVRPETERRTAIRQTVPTKAPVEAEKSTIVDKRLFFKEFHFEQFSPSQRQVVCWPKNIFQHSK